ncbi:MAG: hypothetical protein J6V68_01625 [Clostridia bacterium]|nr:hypothetical protein [Clostridia bacterium]
MRKTIIKTALITLGAILTVFIVTFTIVSLCAPKAMLKLTSGLGMDNLALTYSEQQYKNSETLSDLEDLLYRANELGRDDLTVKYSPIMINSSEFESFSNSRTTVGVIEYKSYIIGNYLIALYNESESKQVVIEKASEYFTAFYSGYELYNPYNVLVINAKSFSTEFRQSLKTHLTGITVSSGNELLQRDINAI